METYLKNISIKSNDWILVGCGFEFIQSGDCIYCLVMIGQSYKIISLKGVFLDFFAVLYC
jgi:hypothetical protein